MYKEYNITRPLGLTGSCDLGESKYFVHLNLYPNHIGLLREWSDNYRCIDTIEWRMCDDYVYIKKHKTKEISDSLVYLNTILPNVGLYCNLCICFADSNKCVNVYMLRNFYRHRFWDPWRYLRYRQNKIREWLLVKRKYGSYRHVLNKIQNAKSIDSVFSYEAIDLYNIEQWNK